MKLFYGSSYDRGLIHLLKMWPKIRESFPDAELHVCYGWDLFLKALSDNPERMAWKARVDELLKQEGVVHHGRIGKAELKEIRSQCAIWCYPTDFDEINCITALECQRDGAVPCVVNRAALKETVRSGTRIEGEIWEPDTKETYLTKLLELMGDTKQLDEEREKGKRFADNFTWSKIAQQWHSQAF